MARRNQRAEIAPVESVHVLIRNDRLRNAPGVEMSGQRQLDQDAVYAWIAIESFDFIKQVGEIIHHDFGQEFRELSLTAALEPIAPYQLESLEDCKNKLLHVYSLYADMVQRYNALLAERNK